MTIRLQKILLPTDFSNHSTAATKYACEMASKFDAELHVLHILEQHFSSTPSFAMGLDLPRIVSESKVAAQEKMRSVLEPGWSNGRKVIYSMNDGAPKVEIVRYAKAHDVDMIVLSTHGRSGLSHVLLGSVAENIVRTAPCPVLTIRPEGHQFVMP